MTGSPVRAPTPPLEQQVAERLASHPITIAKVGGGTIRVSQNHRDEIAKQLAPWVAAAIEAAVESSEKSWEAQEADALGALGAPQEETKP